MNACLVLVLVSLCEASHLNVTGRQFPAIIEHHHTAPVKKLPTIVVGPDGPSLADYAEIANTFLSAAGATKYTIPMGPSGLSIYNPPTMDSFHHHQHENRSGYLQPEPNTESEEQQVTPTGFVYTALSNWASVIATTVGGLLVTAYMFPGVALPLASTLLPLAKAVLPRAASSAIQAVLPRAASSAIQAQGVMEAVDRTLQQLLGSYDPMSLGADKEVSRKLAHVADLLNSAIEKYRDLHDSLVIEQ